MQDSYRLDCPALPDSIRVGSVTGKEAISEIYRFDVGLIVSDEPVAMADIVGSPAVLTMGCNSDAPLVFHGVLCSLECLHEWNGLAVVRVALVPRLHNATLNERSRVFIDESVIQIAEAILTRNGFGPDDYALKISGEYEPREFVCQYRESDMAFMARQLERAGLYFFFEQGDEHEKLIITDDKAFQTSLRSQPVRYVPFADERCQRRRSVAPISLRDEVIAVGGGHERIRLPQPRSGSGGAGAGAQRRRR